MWGKHAALWMGLWAGLTLLKNPTASAPPKGWTPVLPLHGEYQYVSPDAGKDVSFSAFLVDAAGDKIYKFECHSDQYPDISEISWSGPFQCVLFPFRIDTVSPVNVLAVDDKDEQSTDWFNRGRLMEYQLQGECLKYPEYSTLRHFKLRGMDLTLGYSDMVWQGGKLMKFTLHLDVTPDADAKSPMAEPAEGPKPPRGCYP